MPTARRNRGVTRIRQFPGGSIILATAIHAAVAAAFLHAIAAPRDLDWIVAPRTEPETPGEQLRYVEVRREPSLPTAPVVDRLTRSAISRTREPEVTPRIAPAATDTVAIQARTPVASTGVGDASATVDANRTGGAGLVPVRSDPRIWNARAPSVAPEPSHTEVLEGSLARAIRASNDSIAALGVQTVRPDWVVSRGGGSLGIDNSRIHLGRVSLPAVLLGVLPIPGFGCMPTMYFPDRPVRDSAGITCLQLENPNVAERARRINEMSAEIRARAELTARGREEIARIAARKDREREARLRAQPNAPIRRVP